ncbi:MAG: GTPase HflX [Leptospirales bacterium]
MDASSLLNKKLDSGDYTALLIGQYGSREYPSREIQEESLHELFLLSDTAGIFNIYDMMVANRNPDAGYFFTGGTLTKAKESIQENSITLVIVDANLRPAQIKNLEELWKIRVIGRVELILDIFAMRAKTKEAALQVELAQLTYILPRLKGLGGVLSRLGGGIGTRGPGETMLETDRRHIRRRIQKIKKDLVQVSKHRANARKNRTIHTFSLVGYTNAGKTSLLNRLSSSAAKLFAEDRLFATLDSYTRKVYLGEKDYKPLYCIVSDTVGFIRNLPLNLAAAFKSTLEEVSHVETIILVADASSLLAEEEIKVVEEELDKLEVSATNQILFFNKNDLVFPEEKEILEKKYPGAIWGDTLSKEGVSELRKKMFIISEGVTENSDGQEVSKDDQPGSVSG